MKKNLPITEQEHIVPPGASIVSKTDLKGIITYVNDTFIQISGFSSSELIGKSHNIVRHPDMPPQAFAHMWSVLKKGQPWKGIVKNRSKDGGFYWVKAVVVPIRKDDITIGYMSVREAATREEINQAAVLYEDLNKSGKPIQSKMLDSLMTIRTGFNLGSVFVILLMVAGGILGIGGLKMSDSSVETMYERRLQPLADVARLESLVSNMQLTMTEQVLKKEDETENANKQALAILENNRKDADRIIESLRKEIISGADKRAFDVMSVRYEDVLNLVLLPFEKHLLGLKSKAADEQKRRVLISTLRTDIGVLQQSIRSTAEHDYLDMKSRNKLIWEVALAGIVFGIAMVGFVGRIFLRDIVIPLNNAIHNFDRIAQGDLTGDVEVFGKGETGQLNRASAVMQMHLKVITDEISLVADGIHAHCRQLNGALFEIVDHSEVQHDQLYQARNLLSEEVKNSTALLAAANDLQTLLLETCANNLATPEDTTANLVEALAKLEMLRNSMNLQGMVLEDLLARVEQITGLVMDNMQDTQDSYSLSERLSKTADHMTVLVGYFSPSPHTLDDNEIKADTPEV